MVRGLDLGERLLSPLLVEVTPPADDPFYRVPENLEACSVSFHCSLSSLVPKGVSAVASVKSARHHGSVPNLLRNADLAAQ
jgi:hypothetical protein